MPPRANLRRSTRATGPDGAAASRDNLTTFAKPNLPPLQGTPSSRRQYSYGAAVEPQPMGRARGARQEAGDFGLSYAVQNALVQDTGGNQSAKPAASPAKPKAQARQPKRFNAAADEDDELASNDPKFGSTPKPAQVGKTGIGKFLSTSRAAPARDSSVEVSDMDDARSFGIESDYYGDATIASTPVAPNQSQPKAAQQPPPPSSLPDVPLPGPPAAPDTQQTTHDDNPPPFPLPEPSKPQRPKVGAALEELDEYDFMSRSSLNSAPPRSRPDFSTPVKRTHGPRLPNHRTSGDDELQEEESDGDDGDDDDDNDDDAGMGGMLKKASLGRRQQKNTPASRGLAQNGSKQPTQDRRTSIMLPPPDTQGLLNIPPIHPPTSPFPQQPPPSSRTRRPNRDRPQGTNQQQRGLETVTNGAASAQTPESRRQLRPGLPQPRPWLFTKAPKAAEVDASFNNRRQDYASDHSEMDDAMQRDIEDSEQVVSRQGVPQAAEAQREAQQEAQQEAQRKAQREAQREAWQQQWERLASYSPLRSGQQGRQQARRQTRSAEASPNPYLTWTFYTDSLRHLAGFIIYQISLLLQWVRNGFIGKITVSFVQALPYIMTAGVGILIAAMIATAAQDSLRGMTTISVSASWPSAGEVTSRIRGWMPDIPTMSWPSRSSILDDIPLNWDLDEAGRLEFKDMLRQVEQQLSALARADRLHSDSLEKLKNILPKVVHMDSRNGKPVVAQEFWYSLRDWIREDDSIMTFNTDGKSYKLTSDRQWQAFKSRLERDPIFDTKLNASAAGLERHLSDKMTSSWDSWVRNNHGILSDILGSELDKLQAAGSNREFEQRLSKIFKTHMDDKERSGLVVSRDEFLRHLGSEFAAHRAEIKAELDGIQPKLEKLIRSSVDAAAQQVPRGGLSEHEVAPLVSKLVRKSIADMNLDAMAKGKIYAHWDADLKHRVDYFGIASGAVIHHNHTSPTYDPMAKGVAADKDVAKSLLRPRAPRDALTKWADQGDCWCAARSNNKRGNPHGAMLSVIMGYAITPTHIVIEHILPGATTDPGARPRDVEVYAKIEDSATRERVRDFAAVHFPDDTSDWNYAPAEFGDNQFVKIGRMVYEGAELHDGVYPHRLSPELEELGVETEHIVVRAVSNYGAKDHTCFYRVRMYGNRAGSEKSQ